MTPRLALLAMAIFAVAGHARADHCTSAPFDPFCGSRASSSAGFDSQEIDALGDDPEQTVGPVHTTRLPDPTDPNGQGNLSDESALATLDFAAGVFAVEAGTESGAVDFGLIVSAGAHARVAYDEYLTVSSASLPPGTPVTLRLRYRVAFGANALHDVPPASVNDSTEYARADLQLNMTFGGAYSTNRWFGSATGASIVDGVFDDPAQLGEKTAQATVGQTSRLVLEIRTDESSQATIYMNTFPNASTAATAAVVFGVEADEAGVTLGSPKFGAVPDFSGVTAAHAFASVLPVDVGAPVTVPEPGAPASLGVVGAALAALRRGSQPGSSHASE